jgi:acyl-coenzyme A thioesterase PaaI-like protein
MPEQPAPSGFVSPPLSGGGVRLCAACRPAVACRLGVTSERLDEAGVAQYELHCPTDQEGGPGVAHGGWTAGVLDELLGHVPLLHQEMSVTGTLTVRFVKPVPIERPLLGRAWIDSWEGRKWMLSGDLRLASSGAVLATATGVWIGRDASAHFSAFQEWLAAQDGAG